MLKEGPNQRRCGSMKVTESDNLKHRQLPTEGYLRRVSAEQREYAEACESPKIIETTAPTPTSRRKDCWSKSLTEKI
jgi:hypothetical protein